MAMDGIKNLMAFKRAKSLYANERRKKLYSLKTTANVKYFAEVTMFLNNQQLQKKVAKKA